jgi:transglutaminase-like putative cysteine protease
MGEVISWRFPIVESASSGRLKKNPPESNRVYDAMNAMGFLRIFHETTYRYSRPVTFGPHRLVLRPREGHDIRVEEMRLEIEPKFQLHWSRDVFGNSVATVQFLEPGALLSIRNYLVLQQGAPFPLEGIHPAQPIAFPPDYSPLESELLSAYRTPVFPDDSLMVRNWAQKVIGSSNYNNSESVVALLNRHIHDTIRPLRREIEGVQPPALTLSEGSGSCRDLATLLMEALRALGLPARFASGYLDCSASESGCASTHAWAETYLPEIGWTGYDPTSGEATSREHVVIGISNHPRGVMPVAGSYRGFSYDSQGMSVRVQTERCEQLPSSEPNIPLGLQVGC